MWDNLVLETIVIVFIYVGVFAASVYFKGGVV
jgi:hypothetical protein